MKKIIKTMACAALMAFTLGSCTNFLTVEPKNFMSPDNYFNSESEMEDAANGLYGAVGSTLFSGLVAVNHTGWIMYELLTGYHDRTYPYQQEILGVHLPLLEDNSLVKYCWDHRYAAINNCNNVIKGIENSTSSVSEEVRNRCLAEAYALRAYYYFGLVREFGPVPVSVEPTSDTKKIALEPVPETKVYEQIVSDLLNAESLLAGTAMNPGSGHIGLGAVKSILAKVYLTMAGYPLQDSSCWQKAYDKAKEVVKSGEYSLFESYSDLRVAEKENQGEWIFAVQNAPTYSQSGTHSALLPYGPNEVDASSFSANGVYGGSLVPTSQFIATFTVGDKRAAEKGWFYSSWNGLEFTRPYIFKFFDDSALADGKSGEDFPIIRYADVLLMLAEAACKGGTTSDADAIDAFYQVRHRALPSYTKPASLTFDDVYKERVWELCFEAQNWYDIIRTRKILDVANNRVVDVVGFKPIQHDSAFKADDLYFPYPLSETRLNENLKR